jgi:arginine decarboxylase-like protein
MTTKVRAKTTAEGISQSQVPDIGVIKRAVREATRFYAKLSKMGHPMQFIEGTGGLRVDYDATSFVHVAFLRQ